MSDLSLPNLYARSLESSSNSVNLPTINDETQELIQSTLRDLKEVHNRIRNLSLFSPNEILDDISTKNLVYLTLPYVLAEVENRVRTTERSDRMNTLTRVISFYQTFVHQLEVYGIIPEDEKALYATKASTLVDPSKRREAKVNQYKKLKEIKDRIQVLQKRRNQNTTSTSSLAETDFDLISSLLPIISTSPSSSAEEEELDSDTDEILRSSSTLLLRIFYAQTQTQLESIEQELELLRNAPPAPSDVPPPPSLFDTRIKSRIEEEEQTWRLDMNAQNRGLNAKGPLLDSHGRPLRPFTILPSDSAERARLQAQVFGPGYNLPTMSVDEYLQIEKERGNIITGGGPASLEQPTSSEQLQIDSEMDGTVAGEAKAEEKRQKDEKWALFKDMNPKGAGNTMNRG